MKFGTRRNRVVYVLILITLLWESIPATELFAQENGQGQQIFLPIVSDGNAISTAQEDRYEQAYDALEPYIRFTEEETVVVEHGDLAALAVSTGIELSILTEVSHQIVDEGIVTSQGDSDSDSSLPALSTTPAVCSSRPLLKYGDGFWSRRTTHKRPSVRGLQTLLNQKSRAGLRVDGLFGWRTRSAVRTYQRQHGLSVDGIVGPQTWGSLCGSLPPSNKVCPIPLRKGTGGFTYSNDYGNPRVGHRHQGNDLFAPRGTAIVAIESGRAWKGTNRLGGNVTRLIGDSGAYYYLAHLEGWPGTLNGTSSRNKLRVTKGQVIGYVGTSGNARGTPPHLHMEMRPTGQRRARTNPFPHLEQWCR